ncbi:putative quinol monooxygenase [Methylobacterium tarhaniae]|uniref:putative quinol monooxygenase n=1 Tax=Methylobacterium tarhaniae TaxID=1187852 RepID=UPI003D00241E
MIEEMSVSSIRTALVGAVLLGALSQARAQTGPGPGYAGIPDGAFSVIAEVRAKPGKEDALRAATLPLVPLVRGDPKNLVYFLQEDRFSSGHFIFYEVFASEADFEAHNAQPYVRAWFAQLPDLALGGVQAMKMKVLRGAAP